MPPQPTAQTSVLALPHTPQTWFVVPLETEDHTVPSQCRIVPFGQPGEPGLHPQPPPHTPALALPHTAGQPLLLRHGTAHRPPPSRRTRAPPPTAEHSGATPPPAHG